MLGGSHQILYDDIVFRKIPSTVLSFKKSTCGGDYHSNATVSSVSAGSHMGQKKSCFLLFCLVFFFLKKSCFGF